MKLGIKKVKIKTNPKIKCTFSKKYSNILRQNQVLKSIAATLQKMIYNLINGKQNSGLINKLENIPMYKTYKEQNKLLDAIDGIQFTLTHISNSELVII